MAHSKGFLTSSQLYRLAGKIGHSQQIIAMELGIDKTELERIQSDYVGRAVDQNFQILMNWRERQPLDNEKRYEDLYKCMDTLEEKTLASMVKKYYDEFKGPAVVSQYYGIQQAPWGIYPAGFFPANPQQWQLLHGQNAYLPQTIEGLGMPTGVVQQQAFHTQGHNPQYQIQIPTYHEQNSKLMLGNGHGLGKPAPILTSTGQLAYPGYQGGTGTASGYRTTISEEDITKCKKYQKYVCQVKYGTGCASGFVFGFYPMRNHQNQMRCTIMTSMHIREQFNQALQQCPETCKVVFNWRGTESHTIPSVVKIGGICTEPNSGREIRDDNLDFLLFYLEQNEELFQSLKETSPNGGLAHFIREPSKTTKRLILVGHPEGRTVQYDNIILESQEDLKGLVLARQRAISQQDTLDENIGRNLHLLSPQQTCDLLMFYSCQSYHGSSGSPLFEINDNTNEVNLIGIQKDGIYATNKDPKHGDPCEFGIGVKAFNILECIKQIVPDLFQ